MRLIDDRTPFRRLFDAAMGFWADESGAAPTDEVGGIDNDFGGVTIDFGGVTIDEFSQALIRLKKGCTDGND